ncbi:replication initiation protein [Mesorhizobium sp. B2-4-17]|uniref:replication initiation protein n=1 Tax=Mesorhizobium sp. B2-4-17 TaxID=2589932 RepID=UPI0015E479E7|nr:replication initiation protein [Mesorhizobium sp. B2-4-17]
MTDRDEGLRQSPQVKKPRDLVEGMRVSGEDRLTAHDQAVYEQMLAFARDDGIEKDWHSIAVGDIQAFIGVDHVDRMVESLNRIAGTLVSYDIGGRDFRKRGRFPLAIFEVTEDLRSSAAVLEYMIPPPVRRLILESSSYAKLEINAFPWFKSKYTARLYPRLALRAGYDAKLRKAWTVRPRELADELGYPYKIWNYAHFRRDCLDRVLDDIATEVRRFSVRVDEVHGTGRGRPVETLAFQTSEVAKDLREVQASPILRSEKDKLQAPDHAHQPDELPSASAVSRAMTLTGKSADELATAWRSALDRAKAFNGGGGPAASGAQEAWLLHPLKHEGADAAFGAWISASAKDAPLVTARAVPPRPPVLSRLARRPTDAQPQQVEPAPVPFSVEASRTPVVVVDEPGYKRTSYPAQRVAPPRAVPAAPVIVDDPFDHLDDLPTPASRYDEVCPF